MKVQLSRSEVEQACVDYIEKRLATWEAELLSGGTGDWTPIIGKATFHDSGQGATVDVEWELQVDEQPIAPRIEKTTDE